MINSAIIQDLLRLVTDVLSNITNTGSANGGDTY